MVRSGPFLFREPSEDRRVRLAVCIDGGNGVQQKQVGGVRDARPKEKRDRARGAANQSRSDQKQQIDGAEDQPARRIHHRPTAHIAPPDGNGLRFLRRKGRSEREMQFPLPFKNAETKKFRHFQTHALRLPEQDVTELVNGGREDHREKKAEHAADEGRRPRAPGRKTHDPNLPRAEQEEKQHAVKGFEKTPHFSLPLPRFTSARAGARSPPDCRCR